ncbi:NmrA-like family protein, partial [Pseudoneurospora amorphoporcata]
PHVYHFDGKAEVEEYTRSVGVPSTFFLAGFYMSNLPGQTFRFDNGKWTLALPTPSSSLFPVFDTADTGKFVKAAILHRDETLGKRLLGATEYMTGDQLVEGFKKVFPEAGKTASYYQLPEDVYLNILKGLGMPEFVAQELLENMLLLGTFGYFGGESLDWTHSLVEEKLTTWEEFIKTPVWNDLK